nr:hypothetical protein [Streptomyces griseus]
MAQLLAGGLVVKPEGDAPHRFEGPAGEGVRKEDDPVYVARYGP